MNVMRRQPIEDASVWTGADLEADRSWSYQLEPVHLNELAEALKVANARGLGMPELTAENFPLPTLSRTMADIGRDLKSGRGFALLSGFPVDDYPIEDLETLYWGLCSHIGTGLSQNSDGGFIHYVTVGKRRPNQGTRGVGFPKRSPLHVDLMDIVSLLCVRPAPDDPPSWIASSAAIYNEFLRRYPEHLPRLLDGVEWDRMDEHGEGESPSSGYRVPIFSEADGQMSCRYNRHWMASASRRNLGAVPAEDEALYDLFDELANEVRFEFPFRAGDIQFANNYTALHGRAAHTEESEEERQRLLMRIWLDVPGFRNFADEAIMRYGIGRHGQLGWSAEDMVSGRNRRPRARRTDGAIALDD